MTCALCAAQKEEFRIVTQTQHSFAIVNHEPLKAGHVMVLPLRHARTLAALTPAEAKDLLDLVEHIQKILLKIFSEDPLVMMNTGKHSTEEHVHIHVVPSKGNLRALIASYEGVAQRQKQEAKKLQEMRDQIVRLLEQNLS